MGASASSSGKQVRRSTEASRRLEQARRRNTLQLAEQREREERVDGALLTYVGAGEKLDAAERECEEMVAEYERKIEQLYADMRVRVSGEQAEQACAALVIHEAGRTVQQVADLLEVSVKEARRLIAAGRESQASDGSGSPEGSTPEAEGHDAQPGASTVGVVASGVDCGAAFSGEQSDLSGVDALKDGSDASLVPAVADSGSEST